MLTNLYGEFRAFQNGCFSFRPRGWFQVPADNYAAILAFIYRNRFVTANHVQRRFGRFLKSDRTTRRHLVEMESLDFLEVQPVNSISPLLPKIFFVTATGRRHLKAAFAIQGKSWEESAHDRRRTSGQSFAHIWHEIAISEFLLSVWEACHVRPDWNLFSLERRSLIKHPAFEINRSRHRRLVPDGMFLINHPKGRIVSFVEIDTGTESQRQLKNKLECYQLWADSHAGQEYLCALYRQAGAANPQPHFRLMFVVAPKVIGSEEIRLRHFQELVSQQPASMQKRLWLTSTAELRVTKPPSVMNDPIWFRSDKLSNLDPKQCFFAT
jgi:hypothetical protein